MGSGSIAKETQPLDNSQVEKSKQRRKTQLNQNNCSIDVIEVSNIALAIKNGDQHVINVELSIGCRNLPTPKAFDQVHTMIILYKKVPQLIEIGRTQVISNDLNPKFLTTFLLPSVSGTDEKIFIYIYKISDYGTEQAKNHQIGTTQLMLQNLIDSDCNELEVTLSDPSAKQRTIVHVSGYEYNGGGTFYEVTIQASGFTGKLQIFYVIEVLKDNDWIPVAKSNAIQIKSIKNFEVLTVSSHKFPGQEASRIRFRCYDISRTQEEVGFTDDMILGALVCGEQKGSCKRIYKNGFVVGNIIIQSWKKINQDSFLNYIVNGARLHLILGIDFTKSTFEGSQPLHHDDDSKNLYVLAIKEIVGMLQYFDYYNQIALYGYGAKLPPHYKSVGHCFALDGNYFQPLVAGGVDKIIKLYRQNLQKIKPHGPSKLSEIINMALEFARSAEGLSTNYYVLIILTDGSVDDYNDTVQKIIEASSYPLSIVLVGLGEGDFTQIKKLDQDQEPLVSLKTNKKCNRDMIDFINFKEYLCEQRNLLTEINLARKTFAEIPQQFVSYMQTQGIRPNKQKKGIKTATSEFISQKINAGKKKEIEPIIPQVQFLKEQKKIFVKQLQSLGVQRGKTFDETLQISMNDQNYFLEIYASKLPPPVNQPIPFHQNISFHQQKRFQQRLQKKQKIVNHRIQNQIFKKQANQIGKRQRLMERAVAPPPKPLPKLNHPCLKCRLRQICIIYGECGHLAVCQECQQDICILCKQCNDTFFNINDYDI